MERRRIDGSVVGRKGGGEGRGLCGVIMFTVPLIPLNVSEDSAERFASIGVFITIPHAA